MLIGRVSVICEEGHCREELVQEGLHERHQALNHTPRHVEQTFFAMLSLAPSLQMSLHSLWHAPEPD